MRNAITYLTRACPRTCSYCALRDGTGVGKQLTVTEWKRAFDILQDIQVDFNLILGNETWYLGLDLLEIMFNNKVPFALYTTCPEPYFEKYRDTFFTSGVIDNLSCGVDYPPLENPPSDDSYIKSKAALCAFEWVKQHYPDIDTQGTITIHAKNYKHLPRLITHLSSLGVFVGVNLIHYNKDGNFDFFPTKEELGDLLFTDTQIPELLTIFSQVLRAPGLLQNPNYLQRIIDAPELLDMNWHCMGNPYGGPTIDADGSLRVCGYRKGVHTPKISIFQLPEKLEEWRTAVYQDAMECPGCHWTYPIMYHYELLKGDENAKNVFIHHAGGGLLKDKWAKRNLSKK